MNEQAQAHPARTEQELNAEKRVSTADIAATAGGCPPAVAEAKAPSITGGDGSHPAPLLAAEEADKFRGRWSSIQTGFVDDPRHSVEEADTLVASLMKRLAETFADERAGLEAQWGREGNVSTEDLRMALRKYRSFFDRLLSV